MTQKTNRLSHPRDSNSVPIPYEGIALPDELGWQDPLSRCPGLNWGPHSYHECALPTELQRLIFKHLPNSYNGLFLRIL